MAQSELDLLRDIRDSLRGGGRSFSGGGSTGGGGGGLFASGISGVFNLKELLTDATKGVANGMDSLFRGSMDASKALGMMTETLSAIPFLGNISGGVDMVGKAIIDANQIRNEVGKYGADFHNNILELNEKVSGAGITLDQYANIVRDNSTALMGLGATSNKAQTNFLELAKGFREDSTVRQLQALGLSAEEAAQYMVVSLANQTRLDVYSENGKRIAIENTLALASSMEETTRITGISRKQQQDDLQAATAKAQVQAALRMLPPEAQAQFEMMHTKFEALGPAINDLTEEIFTGGVRTKAGGDMMGALGPAGVMLEKAVIANKNAHTASEKAAAEQMMSQAQLAVNNRMMEKSFNEMGVYVTSGAGDAVRSMIEQNKMFASAQAGLTESQLKNKNATLEETMAKQKAAANLELQGKDPKTGKPFEDAGSKLGESVNIINRSLTDVTAGFNKNLHTAIKSVDGFSTTLDTFIKSDLMKPRTQEQSAAAQADLLKSAGDKIKSLVPEGLNVSPLKTEPTHNLHLRDMYKGLGLPHRESGSPGMQSFLNGSGAFDNMFDKFNPEGELAVLHGEEVVATKQQMNQFRTQLSDQITNLMRASGTMAKASPIQPIVDEIHTAISQVSKVEKAEPDLAPLTNSIQKIATPMEKNAADLSTHFESAIKDVKIPDLTQAATKIGEDFKVVFANVKPPETTEMMNKVEENIKTMTTETKPLPFDSLVDQVKSTFDGLAKNIEIPKFETITNDFEKGIDKVSDIKVPSFGELFDDVKDGFATITNGFELPNVSGVMDDIGKSFSSVTDKFELPDLNIFSDKMDEKLTSTTKDFKPPEVNSLFTDFGKQFTSLSTDFKAPDMGEFTTQIKKDLTTVSDKIEKPEINKSLTDTTAKVGEDIAKKTELPSFDKLFASVADTFANTQKEQLKNHLEQERDNIKKQIGELSTVPKDKTPPVVTPTPAQIKNPIVSKPLNTTPITEQKKVEAKKQEQPQPAPPPPVPVPVSTTQAAPQNAMAGNANAPATMQDLLVQLEQINKSLAQIAQHSNEAVTVAQKQVRATKGLSNDRFA